MKLAIKFAFTYIKKRNNYIPSFSSIASSLGVAIGVSALIIVVTTFHSMEKTFKEITHSYTPDLAVAQFNININNENYKKTEEIIKQISHLSINKYSKFQYTQIILRKKFLSTTSTVYAIEGQKSTLYKKLKHKMSSSKALQSLNNSILNSEMSIILATGVAENLNASVGDIINVSIFSQNSKSLYPLIKKAKVAGIINFGLNSIDSDLVFMSYAEITPYISKDNLNIGTEISFKNKNDINEAQKILKAYIPNAIIYTVETQNKQFFSVIERDGNIIKIIVGIITLVAAFNILTVLNLSVVDRAKQISILRALGASRNFIIIIFTALAGILGTIGALLGLLISIIILTLLKGTNLGNFKEAYYVTRVPVYFELNLCLKAVFLAIILSLAGGIIPAFRAASISPILGIKFAQASGDYYNKKDKKYVIFGTVLLISFMFISAFMFLRSM